MSDVTALRERLRRECDTAFMDPVCGTSCSHAVNRVVRTVMDRPTWPHRTANALVKFLEEDRSWVEERDMATIHRLANEGVVVIGGKAETTGSGHVIVVYPGTLLERGGYTYFSKKKQANAFLPKGAKYPRALSTSSGQWPGAKSMGDRTVWDPWGNDAAFAAVRFWRPAESH